MRVLKHSTWMNPLALRPENALIRSNFSSHKRESILVAARLLHVLSAEPGPRFLYIHTILPQTKTPEYFRIPGVS
jgi:hypothetical protein